MSDQAHRRLLDLLAGWTDYVHACSVSEEPHPGVTAEEYGSEADAIVDLYQRAGGFEEVTPELLAETMKAIIQLVVHGPQKHDCCDHDHE